MTAIAFVPHHLSCRIYSRNHLCFHTFVQRLALPPRCSDEQFQLLILFFPHVQVRTIALTYIIDTCLISDCAVVYCAAVGAVAVQREGVAALPLDASAAGAAGRQRYHRCRAAAGLPE
jgi:hypothetical protein